MARRKTRARKKKKTEIKQYSEIKGFMWIVIGFILAIGIYTNLAGYFSAFSKNVLFSLLGIGAFVMPLYLIYFGAMIIYHKGELQLGYKFYPITFLAINTLLLVASINMDIRSNNTSDFFTIIGDIIKNSSPLDGGILGFTLAYPLYKILGFVGSIIVYMAIYVICIVITFNLSIRDMGKNIKDKGKRVKEDLKNKNIQLKEREPDINLEVEKSKVENEYIDGINKKIKILDFMKNAEIHNEPFAEEKNKEIAVFQMGDLASDVSNVKSESTKSKKLENDVKEDVNKEIVEKISEVKTEKEYIIPNLDYLNANSGLKINKEDKKELIASANKLEETLSSFGVEAKVLQVTKGPAVTRYELQPNIGVKVSKIVNLSDDISLSLAASGVRIEAPIPGKSAVGIEVPNKKVTPVFLREVLESNEFKSSTSNVAFALGKDIAGQCIVTDLSKMPHLLIAGATGSGKSVCINTLIMSILYKYSPEDVALLMIDPKVVELNVYNGIPHLLIPVVTDPKKAAAALNWAVNEMTRRYKLFADLGVRNVQSYNALLEKGQIEAKLPYIVIIVDELADLMMVCPNDVEEYIARLAQMARAAGMHLVLATQRPSVDVITGVIKANIPSRISFAVSSQVDSRTILDSSGAEKLLGKGDMLFYPVGESKPLRIQGAFISEEEVEKVVSFIKSDENNIQYKEEIIDHINSESVENNKISDDDTDELLDEAINIVVESGQASASFIQRRLRIGFNRAARIIEQLEERGIISAKDGTKPRQVLISKSELEEF
ncbi:FtsK/SpoIIIE family DNA translocase [Clostridium paridis]|uniref:DNA translocase FtsK 4TM domain-containing protein n=1 Tax=Clostridium paridis TaxID=2803863 RepID=A0A937FFF3_9CLOT|nr:DNA translocase FtsK [Clostridium paridis]MBL4930892.1 DNA translocase FtsK 4TM domain-containing protein [Clostridium paridis]